MSGYAISFHTTEQAVIAYSFEEVPLPTPTPSPSPTPLPTPQLAPAPVPYLDPSVTVGAPADRAYGNELGVALVFFGIVCLFLLSGGNPIIGSALAFA